METAVQTCYRHPDRRAGVICQRCDRPICPDCMNQASVGFHCPECMKGSGQKVIRGTQLRTPGVLTNVLIALNLAVYAAGIGSGLRTKESFIIGGGLIGEGRVFEGAQYHISAPFGELVGVAHGEWWRMLSSGFLHGSLLHIGFNMWVLYQLGRLLEPVLGRVRFGIVYVVAMLCGSFGVLLLEPDAFTVGASGAVFGLMGAAVAAFRSRGINPFDTGLGGAIVLNLVFTFSIPGISIGGHVGGLIGGFLAGWLLLDIGPRYIRHANLTTAAVAGLGVLAALGGVLVV
ncbi:MAG: rhomboid family intramembrane serine protease [Acidimicrobiales bacterium]